MSRRRLFARIVCAALALAPAMDAAAGEEPADEAPAPSARGPARKVLTLPPAARQEQGTLKFVRVWMSPPSVGQSCFGEFAVRNNGPDIAPDPKVDLYRADLEVRNAAGAVLFRSYWSHVGTGIARGEVVACKWETLHNAAVPGPGLYPKFVIPSAGEYALAITLFRTGHAEPLDTHVERFKVAGIGGAKAPVQPLGGPLRVVGLSVEPASVGQTCSGEFSVRNEGGDIAPEKDDLFQATVEISASAGFNSVPLFRTDLARVGTGIAKGEVVTMQWDTKSNTLNRAANNGYLAFTLPKPGVYDATVTIYRYGRNLPVDVRTVRFQAAYRPAGGRPPAAPPIVKAPAPVVAPVAAMHVPAVAPAAGAPVAAAPVTTQPTVGAPAVAAGTTTEPTPESNPEPPVLPTALKLLSPYVAPSTVGRTISGRFVIRNTGRAYQAQSGGESPGWRIIVWNPNHTPVFQTSGQWGPGMRENEELEITWDSRTNERADGTDGRGAFLPAVPGTHHVELRVFAREGRVLDDASYDFWVSPTPRR